MNEVFAIIRKILERQHLIIEKRHADEALRRSEEKYRNTINNLDVGFYKGELNGKLLMHNQALNKILGIDVNTSLVGLSASQFFANPKDQNKYLDNLTRNGFIRNFNAQIRKPDGEHIMVELNSHLIKKNRGETLLVEGTVLDITEKFRFEQRLKESEEKVRNLVNNISDVLIEADTKGVITFISPQICNIISYQAKEITGTKLIEHVNPEDLQFNQESFKKALKSRSPISLECRIRHKKGYYIPISLRGSFVKIRNTSKFYGIIRDITERRRVDDMINREIKKLKELDRIRNDLVTRMSHELKTPLVSIFSGAKFLLNDFTVKLDNGVRSIIRNIYEGSFRLNNMVDNLLTVFEIDSQTIKLNKSKENLIPIITQCIEDIMFLTNKRNVSINVELLDNLFLDVDKDLIKKATFNIISNAVKNTPSNGNVYISTIEHHNYVELVIKDTGVGITKKEMVDLFKPFGKIERYGQGLDVDIEGPGLGLYIANEIIKLHEGEIVLKSKGRSKGSTFTIRLNQTSQI